MNKNINTLRATANNLTTLLCMQVKKKKITKPGALIPGAISAAGYVMTLDTKDNSADIVVQKDNKEIQRAKFNYKETADGYEMVSAESAYMYDDKDNKEVHQNYYLIEPDEEKILEYSINYTDAPIRTTTRKHIDKINSSIAQASGYKSSKTDYDPQESHTYGKKSLQRDIPVLSQLLDIISPNSNFILRIKDKLKKDNKTSLVAFEASDTESGSKVVRGFMSSNGDSVSYHIDTDDMTIVGEQSPNKKLSRAYLKPETTTKVQEEAKSDSKAEAKSGGEAKAATLKPDAEAGDKPKAKVGRKPKATTTKQEAISDNEPKADSLKPKAKVGRKPKVSTPKPEAISDNEPKADSPKPKAKVGRKPKVSTPKPEGIKKDEKQETVSEASTKVQETQAANAKIYHNCTIDFYRNLILDAITNGKLSTREKVETYKEILALAYVDRYNRDDLINILSFFQFSNDCKAQYVNAGIKIAEKGEVKIPVKTLDDKTKELQNIELDIDDEFLKACIKNMTSKKEIAKIQDDSQKENFVDTALNLLKNSSSKDFLVDLLSFVQESSKINEDLSLHYEIYMESVNNKKEDELRTSVGELINKIPDTNHESRDAFIVQWCTATTIEQLEELQKALQDFLYSEQPTTQNTAESPKEEQPKLSIKSLNRQNQKFVVELLTNPRKKAISFKDARNLLKDIGFIESSEDGISYKYTPPVDLFFNGKKQAFITISRQTNQLKPAAVADLIKICKQYYGSEIN